MIRSALFIDFDNFFSGLLDADPVAALELVERPSAWLQQLADTHTDGAKRRWLVLRCYMNPAGWVPDPADKGQRLYFSKFRPFFTQAGIEVVDCPSLTRNAKNGADIRIVIDVMAAMRANTRYDEFVLASSDADFTPLLQVLRADDRRVTIIATGSTASAFEALADRTLDEQDMLELAPRSNVDTRLASTTGPIDAGPQLIADPAPTTSNCRHQEAFAVAVQEAYVSAAEPINLSQLAARLKNEFGEVLAQTHWFGSGSFVRALHQVPLHGARLSNHYLWSADRHQPPPGAALEEVEQAEPISEGQTVLPAAVSRFREVTKLPAMPSENWPSVYSSLEAYASLHEFRFAESTKWARDNSVAQGFDISRQTFVYALRSCRDGGAPLNSDPAPSAQEIGTAMLASVLSRSRLAGLEPSEVEVQALADWLHVAALQDS